MEFEFTPDALMLRDMLRRFIEKEVRPLEPKYFATGEIEPKERARLRQVIEQMGLWGVTLPEEFGGLGLDTVTTCLLDEELGKTFVPLEFGDVHPLLYACNEEQARHFLVPAIEGKRRAILAIREPSALHPENWTTTVSNDGGRFIIDGTKLLAAAPQPDDFLVVLTRDQAGATAFVFDPDQPGISISQDAEDVFLTLSDCCAGPEALLGEYGQAFLLLESKAPHLWIRLGAQYLGISERLLSMAAAYASDWSIYGAALKERVPVQRALAEMRVMIESARWLIYHAAWVNDQGQPARVEAAHVRFVTTEMLNKAVDLATMIFGGPGPSPQTDIRRFVRSMLPTDALGIAMDSAQILIAEDVLAEIRGS